MRSPSSLVLPLLGLLCASTLVACEPGNSLDRFSGRWLRAVTRSPSGDFLGELRRKNPEAGCLQLHPDVEVTFDGVALVVFPGSPIVDPDFCNAPEDPPTFLGKLDPELFVGAPRNAVMEIRDGDDHIIAEFTNYFARHTFAQVDPPPTVKPGAELLLAWDPPTDDLSPIDKVSLGGVRVPARPERGGVRFTVPADFPAGRVNVSSAASDIPAEHCVGAALCTGSSLLFPDRSVDVIVQP